MPRRTHEAAGAPANSRHTKIPQHAATMGALWPILYDTASDISLELTRLTTVPVVHTKPPKIAQTPLQPWPLLSAHVTAGDPSNGFFIKNSTT